MGRRRDGHAQNRCTVRPAKDHRTTNTAAPNTSRPSSATFGFADNPYTSAPITMARMGRRATMLNSLPRVTLMAFRRIDGGQCE